MNFVNCVIVTYFPDIKSLENLILGMQSQVENIIICDNSPSNHHIEIKENSRIKIYKLDKNTGIANAQNIGFDHSFNNGAKYVVTMDQDSMPEKDLVEKLINAYNFLTKNNYNPGVLGSIYMDNNVSKINKANNFYYEKCIKNTNYSISSFVISSGSLIPKKIYDDIGGMDNKLFIDYVDFEYCWRAKKFGYSTHLIKDAKIFHHHGQGQVKLLFGLINILIEDPIRSYYSSRNLLLLIRRDYVPKIWIILNLFRLLLKIFTIPLMPGYMSKRYKYILKGIYDALKNKSGKIK